MSAASIASVLNAGSGPSVAKKQLRAGTEAIRRATRTARRIEAVGSRFHDDIVGGRLLDLLSDQLRALLDVRRDVAAFQVSPHVRPETRPGDGTRRQAVETRNTSRAVSGDTSHVDAAAGSRVHPEPATVRLHKQQLMDADAGDLPLAAAVEMPPGASRPGRTDVNDRLSRPRDMRSSVPLVRALRGYWIGPPAAASNTVASAQPNQQRTAGATPQTSGAPASTQPRGLAAEQIAARMDAFARGPFAPHRVDRFDRAQVDHQRPASYGSAKSWEGGVPWLASNTDLAEKLADVLREQAMLHGVDLS